MILVVFTSSVGAAELNSSNVADNSSSISIDIQNEISSVDTDNVELTNLETNKTNEIITSNNNLRSSEISSKSAVLRDSGNYVLNVSTYDVYNSLTRNYTEEGIAVKGVTVKIYDSSNQLVFTDTTNDNGYLLVNSLPGFGKYTIKASYSTYLDQTYEFNYDQRHFAYNNVKLKFKPDICFMTIASGNQNKMAYLMNISKRCYYVDNNGQTKDRFWLVPYANFILVDMYSDSGYIDVLPYILDSTANKNRKIAYVFGSGNGSGTGFNYIGTNATGENTIDTMENTYIGSYYQAYDYNNTKVLTNNMGNLYAYILYLLGESSVDPTKDSARTPLMASTWGIYHPAYGAFEFTPEQEDINKWILKDPGFNRDKVGGLNWMSYEYVDWQKSNSNDNELFKKFETWYNSYQINKADVNLDEITDEKSYLSKIDTSTPFVVIVSYYCGGNLVDSLINEYESQGRAAFNLYQITTQPAMSSLLLSFKNSTKRGVSAVNSLYSWSLNYASNVSVAIEELNKLDVEVLRVLDRVNEDSYTSDQGPQYEWTFGVTIPSFEGVFGTILASYINSTTGQEIVINSSVKKVINMTNGWAKLREMDNYDKKISIVLYNYPPGKSDIGASYLDIYNSTYVLLHLLAKEGYNIGMTEDEIPNLTELSEIITENCNKGSWAQGYINSYVDKHWDRLKANGQLVDLTQYEEYLSMLHPTLQKKLIDYWGEGLGNFMVYNGTKHSGRYIVLPGIMFGNVFLTFQPSRGWESVQDYHSPTLPAHQQYISFYKWMSHTFGANAIIYMGTHGTLEFLPGKDTGLTETDWTFDLVDTPSIYPYIVSNPGEAMIAKDRIGALMISHMTPATVMNELYGNLSELNNLISSYYSAVKVGNTAGTEEYRKSILEIANSDSVKFKLPDKNQTFDSWLNGVQTQLDDLESDIITYGLHTLGKVLSGYELVQEIITITASQTNIYDNILHMLYPNLANLSFYEDIYYNHDYKTEVNHTKQWLIDFLSDLVMNYTFNETLELYNITNQSLVYEDLVFANETMTGICDNMEWESIFDALSGRYVKPGLSGDPSTSSVLPTGRNMYTGDTTKMPTKQSFKTAMNLVNNILVNYYEKNNKFPELTGIIMWGTELLRTDALAIGEFLYFLGVKPVWDRANKVVGVEVIDLDDLKITLTNGTVINRPRVDVFTSMVTSNVNWIKLMVTALNLVNALNESFSVNYIKKNYNETGSLDRLFGLPGMIREGTGLSDFLPATSNWYDKNINLTSEMTGIYMDRVSYSWSLDENDNIVISKKKNTYETLLKKVDLVTQNLDSTWRFLDSDDYYDWFGGMYGTSNRLGGHAQTAVIDVRNSNTQEIRTVEEEIAREVRTTISNPKYINALFSSENAGPRSMAAKVQDLMMLAIVTSSDIGTGQTGNGGSGSYSYGSAVSSETFTVTATAIDSMFSSINSAGASYSWQSMSAWMVYAYQVGLWKPTSTSEKKTLQNLVNKYVESVVKYQNFACCHHTDPWSINHDIVQMYTGNPATLKEFNKLYQEMSDTQNSVYSEEAVMQAMNNANSKAINGTAPQSSSSSASGASSSGSSSGGSGSGAGSVGDSGSSSSAAGASGSQGSGSSSGQSQSQQDSSAGSGSDDGKSYELNKASASASGAQASLPIYVLIAIVVILFIFGFGFFRRSSDDDDDDDENY